MSNLWKDMMTKLNIRVQYAALYRPQSVGMLERQHRSIKESLKAAIEDMGEKYQDRWIDYLPLVLLGRRTALQPDVGASPSELALGTNVRIPGQLLFDPKEYDGPALQDLLHNVKVKTTNPAVQPSSHAKPESPKPKFPDVSHVYTREHQTTGLQPSYQGPFPVVERPSRSTAKIEVGVYKSGEKRYEIRHVNDLRPAHPDSFAAPFHRPKLGRPARSAPVEGQPTTEAVTPPFDGKRQGDTHPPLSRSLLPTPSQSPLPTPSSVDQDESKQTLLPPGDRENSNARPIRATRNPNPIYVDAIWTASPSDLKALNEAINVKC